MEQATNEKAGAFAGALEAMALAHSARPPLAPLHTPTIGTRAGPGNDAQALVIHDLLGLTERPPKPAKAYADLLGIITWAAEAVVADVERGEFPDSDHSYS